ncbi:MAG: trichohyalin-plectin-homology domain domain-containing protein [Verrucomicrobia bacterium]|nr:trichohyalin-plectin-homology domain domain-containing protein [Verrucomicrobiota bacterium]
MKTTQLLVFILLSTTNLCAADGDNQKPFDLTTLLGQTYQHCRIIKATPEAITISHDTGVAKIPFENLNDDWKTRFNYSPEKAQAFQKAEAARLTQAEEMRRELQKEKEKQLTKQISDAAAAENRRWQKLEEALAWQFVDAAAATAVAAVAQPGLMLPQPGDPAPYFDAGLIASRSPVVRSAVPAVPASTEALVPATTPITQIYTPSNNGGQRYIINQGSVFTPGDGSLYYVNPGYPYPGYITPVYTNPPIIICPPQHVRPSYPITPRPVTRSSSSTVRVGP